MSQSFSVIVPTYNPGSLWEQWLECFRAQSVQPDHVLVIDSSSDDGTVELSMAHGFRCLVIPQCEFEHAHTRMLGVHQLKESEILVFLTQDALLADSNSLKNLLAVFEDPSIGAAYGRQLPHLDATPIATHARAFSYPDVSEVRYMQDASALGMKTVRFSNSFGAYRSSALLEVGGFQEGGIFGEDQIAASRMVLRKWKIAYCAEAMVRHSHNYTLRQDFSRYFDIGVMHQNAVWMLDAFGSANGEGWRYIQSELAFLKKAAPASIPEAVVRTILKLCGYKLGRRAHLLPCAVNRKLSMSPQFWKSHRKS